MSAPYVEAGEDGVLISFPADLAVDAYAYMLTPGEVLKLIADLYRGLGQVLADQGAPVPPEVLRGHDA